MNNISSIILPYPDNDNMPDNMHLGLTKHSTNLNYNVENISARYSLMYDSTTESPVNAVLVNNRLENELNREFRYEVSLNSRARTINKNRYCLPRTSFNKTFDREPLYNELELEYILYLKMVYEAKLYF